MEDTDLVLSVCTAELIKLCQSISLDAGTIDEEERIIQQCDDIIVSMMYITIALGRFEDFNLLWINWCPVLDMHHMIETIITNCGGNSKQFLSYLHTTGRFHEYGVII